VSGRYSLDMRGRCPSITGEDVLLDERADEPRAGCVAAVAIRDHRVHALPLQRSPPAARRVLTPIPRRGQDKDGAMLLAQAATTGNGHTSSGGDWWSRALAATMARQRIGTENRPSDRQS
jgi:hypothetical protein